MNLPQYQQLKRHILAGIESGRWAAGEQIPSENQLADQFAMSRMTANRAVRELTDAGVLDRVQGKGTFVAPPQPLQSVLRIEGIDSEIRARGSEYSAKVLSREISPLSKAVAQRWDLPPGERVAHTLIVHYENSVPVQRESRWVNLKMVPNYLDQDFTQVTPHAYLTSVAPMTHGEHTISAVLPSKAVQRELQVESTEPCLLIERRTWSQDVPATLAELVHPGTRYQLSTSLAAAAGRDAYK